MEQCLQIPEILRDVCEQLDRKSWLPAALTSRAFLEPALDQLWYNIESMRPLICCLPVGVVTVKMYHEPTPAAYLVSRPLDFHWVARSEANRGPCWMAVPRPNVQSRASGPILVLLCPPYTGLLLPYLHAPPALLLHGLSPCLANCHRIPARGSRSATAESSVVPSGLDRREVPIIIISICMPLHGTAR